MSSGRRGVTTGPDGPVTGTTGRQGSQCDFTELRRVVAELPPSDLSAWTIGNVDTGRLPIGCTRIEGVNAAQAEARRREDVETADRAARARGQAGDRTEVRQSIPDSISVPLLGEVDTTTAFLAAAGGALVLSGTDGGAAIMGGGSGKSLPDPDGFDSWQSFAAEARSRGFSFAEAGEAWPGSEE